MTVSIDAAQPGAAVPSRFLGLSFEAAAMPALAHYALGEEFPQLLRSLGSGVLRVGGVSADTKVAWSEGAKRPTWASGTITASDLKDIAVLARRSGWRVQLAVNLGHYDPAAAASEARAARALLGAGLAGIEIGNEPDRFPRKGLRGAGWGFAPYARQFLAYRQAIAKAAPGVPVVGPDTSSGEPELPWLRASAALRPSLLTEHYYPLSSCGYSPTLGELLSPALRRQQSGMLGTLASIQRAAAVPLRIDEANDISCKGQPGVSDTFGAALWASDFGARAMAAGLQGLDFHDLTSLPHAYSPLVTTGPTLHANPEWYALLLLGQLLPGARPLPAVVSAGAMSADTVSAQAEVTATAFQAPGGAVQVVLANLQAPGSTPLSVRLHLAGRFAGGTILRLTGPSPSAEGGVELGGSQVSASGAWSPGLPLPGVYSHAGRLALELPPSSAALVTLEPAR